MIQSLLQMYDEGGWMPKWPNPTYSNIMIGPHSDAVIADAFVKNFRNVYNSVTGFMSARNYGGSFLTDAGSHVDEVEQIVEEGITEGGRWTYLFCAMQDVPGLISLIGGKDKNAIYGHQPIKISNMLKNLGRQMIACLKSIHTKIYLLIGCILS